MKRTSSPIRCATSSSGRLFLDDGICGDRCNMRAMFKVKEQANARSRALPPIIGGCPSSSSSTPNIMLPAWRSHWLEFAGILLRSNTSHTPHKIEIAGRASSKAIGQPYEKVETTAARLILLCQTWREEIS